MERIHKHTQKHEVINIGTGFAIRKDATTASLQAILACVQSVLSTLSLSESIVINKERRRELYREICNVSAHYSIFPGERGSRNYSNS